MINLKYYSRLRNIQRLGLMFTHRQYNLMEHQYMCGILFRRFASIEDVAYDINTLDLVLNHDMVESISHDLPWTVKKLSKTTERAWEEIEDEIIKQNFQFEKYSDVNIKSGMTDIQFLLFKVVDYADLYFFIVEEIALGNHSKDILEVKQNCEHLIPELCSKGNFSKILNIIFDYEA